MFPAGAIFGLSSSALRQASRILGDEFSAMGVAVALGLPRSMIAPILQEMAAQDWISPIAANRERAAVHGPWYEPRRPWQLLRAQDTAQSALSERSQQVVREVLRTVRESNRSARHDDPLVVALWRPLARAGAEGVGPAHLELALHLSPHGHTADVHGGDQVSPALGPTLQAFANSHPQLCFKNFHDAVASGTALRPLYRVSHDPGLWFDTTQAVLAFPQDYLDCTLSWAQHPSAFKDVRAHDLRGDVERVTNVARGQLAKRVAESAGPAVSARRGSRRRSALAGVAQQLISSSGR
jgi:hypothetical protein